MTQRDRQESEARFRDLAELSSDWYWEQDANFRFTSHVGGSPEQVAVRPDADLGKTRWELPIFGVSEEDWCSHKKTLAEHRSFRDFCYQRSNDTGRIHSISVSGHPVFDEQGVFCGYRGIARDITALKRGEQLLVVEHAVASCLAEVDNAVVALKAVIHALCETEGWEYGRYWRVDDAAGVLRFMASWHWPDSPIAPHMATSEGTLFEQGSGMVGHVWQSGQPLWVADLTKKAHVVLKVTLEPGLDLHGACMFPVASEGKTIGVLSFVSRVVREPDARLLEAFRVIGSQVGQFLQRKQREEALRQSEARFRLIAEFGQKALANVALEELLRQAAAVAKAGLGVEFCNVLELGRDRRSLLLKASSSEQREWMGRCIADSCTPTQSGHVLSTGEPVTVDDFSTESRFLPSEVVRAYGVRSCAEVPIVGSGGPYGVLGAYLREPGRVSGETVNFLQSLANTLATAMDRKAVEQRLTHLAQFDALTGLANRSLFVDRLTQTLAQAKRSDWLVGVLFIDLDRFKAVNDTLGHDAGDKLLVQVARRLNECVRASDTVGRLGGDEFAAVLSDLSGADNAALVAQKVTDALARPFDLDGQEVYVSASVGIGIFPADGADADSLLRNADTAMYRAKEQGRNAYQFYLPQMNAQALERLQLQTQLRGALERREFVLHYQPKASLKTGEVSGFEALLRWQHPLRGLIAPLQFIQLLEETGLIVPVGEWVVRSVCEQLCRWQAQGLATRPVAVNLSARQLQQGNLDTSIASVLADTGVDAGLLELELTESMLMSDPEQAVRILNNLRAYGVRLSVDDFGTGYSSLAYLKRFPLDALKIDREFIRDVTTDADDASITMAIIGLAHSLKLKVIAEGVETQAQLDFLIAQGCDEMQGHYWPNP